MASVSLYCLYIAAVDFQFHAGAAVTKAMEDNRLQVVLADQQLQLLRDYMFFVRPTIVLHDHKLEILVFRAEFSFQDILILPHFL